MDLFCSVYRSTDSGRWIDRGFGPLLRLRPMAGDLLRGLVSIGLGR